MSNIYRTVCQRVGPWLPLFYAAFLCAITVNQFWSGSSGWWPVFFCFLPMSFFFVGSSILELQRQIRELREEITQLKEKATTAVVNR